MRTGADHHRRRKVRFALALTLALAGSVGCSKTWVLSPDPGGGGAAGGGLTAGAAGVGVGGGGGTPAPAGTGGFPGFGGHGSGMCSATKLLQYNIPPTDLVFVVGRNNSMNTKFGDSTRMTTVQMDLHTVVSGNQAAIDFGYESYPSFTGCSGNGTCCPSTDPVVRAMPFVDIDSALYAPCDANGSGMGMGCVAQTDSRALSQSLSWGAIGGLFGSSDPASQRYAVVLADGPPGCPTEDPAKACGAAQAAVSSLKAGGIKTFVVGVGEDANGDTCLAQLATMGGTGTPYEAADSSSLMKWLTQIVNMASVTPCTINLNLPSEDDPSAVALFVQNKEIPYDMGGGNGWNYAANSTRIQLHGTSCQYLQNFRSQPSIYLWYGCPPCTAANPTQNCL